jgi:hypothetical protein
METDLDPLEEVIVRGKTAHKEEDIDSLAQNFHLLFDGFKHLHIKNSRHK